METSFVRRIPCLDRVYFALALDRKRMKTKGFPPARLEEMQASFAAFKKEALQRKGLVKNETSQPERLLGLAVSAE